MSYADRLRPVRDQVLVRQDAAVKVSKGGIHMPQGAERFDCYGTVLAVGPGLVLANGTRAPMSVEPGMRVLFKRRASSALMPDRREGQDDPDADVLVLRDEDMLAVIEGS